MAGDFPLDERLANGCKARPPDDIDMGGQRLLVEGFVDQPAHFLHRFRRRGDRAGADEAFDDLVIERPALGRTRIAVEGIDRLQAQDSPGIDSIGIAPEAARPR